MVSTWRFWSAKEINFSRRHPFQLLVLLALMRTLRCATRMWSVPGRAGVHVLGDLGARGVWLVIGGGAEAARPPASLAVAPNRPGDPSRSVQAEKEARVQNCHSRRFDPAGQGAERGPIGVAAWPRPDSRCSTRQRRRASSTRWVTRSPSSRPSVPKPLIARTLHFSAAARADAKPLAAGVARRLNRAGSLGRAGPEPGVVVRAPWLGTDARPSISSRRPSFRRIQRSYAGAAAPAVQQAAPVRFAAATVLEPASEFGRAAMDELHQQTVSLLSFQSLPRAIYDAQAAYNLLAGMGESAR